jgi:hypothetical protein
LFAGELEVEGDLKVTGNIDAQNNPIKNVGIPMDMNDAINAQILQDALRDDRIYEVKYYSIKIGCALYEASGCPISIYYKTINVPDFTNGWETHLNTLLQDGWKIGRVFNNTDRASSDTIFLLYELKRLVEE